MIIVPLRARRVLARLRLRPEKTLGCRSSRRETSEDVIDRFLRGPDWAQCDPELGYVLGNYLSQNGIDNSATISTVQANGARTCCKYAGKKCEIKTYGDSFTQCHPVSDGETWQEYLAGHLGEPIRNFGVGGYGVYQAYLDLATGRFVEKENQLPTRQAVRPAGGRLLDPGKGQLRRHERSHAMELDGQGVHQFVPKGIRPGIENGVRFPASPGRRLLPKIGPVA